jgi:hypothetical protein
LFHYFCLLFSFHIFQQAHIVNLNTDILYTCYTAAGIAVGIVTGWPRNPNAFKSSLGHTQSPIQWVELTLLLGMKGPIYEIKHSAPSSAKAKNEHSYTSINHAPSWCAQGQLYLTWLDFTLLYILYNTRDNTL